MSDHKADRSQILAYLRYELVGPWEHWKDGTPVSPIGRELDATGDVKFDDKEASYGPFVQAGTGQEVLQRDRPCKRYGVGVLYPLGVALESDPDLEGTNGPALEAAAVEDEV